MAKLLSHRHELVTRPRRCRDAEATTALVLTSLSSAGTTGRVFCH